jgi:LacI family transcriptional regulator
MLTEMSRIIAVLTADLGNLFYAELFAGIQDRLEAEGYHVLYHHLHHEDETDPTMLQALRAYRPAGYIVASGMDDPKAQNALELAEGISPVVTVEQREGFDSHAVVFDNVLATKLVTDFVLERGHRRIVYFGGTVGSPAAKKRRQGFLLSLAEYDLDFGYVRTVTTGETSEAGYEAARRLLADSKDAPTAIVCFNDMVAMGVYQAAYECGLRIPDDLSVVGFDGVKLGQVMVPPLTTVSLEPRHMGTLAAETLLEAFAGNGRQKRIIKVVEPVLLERHSLKLLESARV